MVVTQNRLSMKPIRIVAATLAAGALLFVGGVVGASIAASGQSAGSANSTLPAAASGEHTAPYGPR
jgi:hypothetical protein